MYQSLLRVCCFKRDEKLSLKELLRAAAYELSGWELPPLDLGIWGFAKQTIHVVSDVLRGNRAPHVNGLVRQEDVGRCGLGGIYHLTRTR